MAKNTERFSDRVENYIRYRPGYPAGVLELLRSTIRFNPGMIVADIGSGTGISAEIFLRNGNSVYAVEPNNEMREAADRLLAEYPQYHSVAGTSEATTLAGHSADLVVAAQAFHWFDRGAFKAECSRIARQGAHCLLLWNERLVHSDFEKAYEDLLICYGNDYTTVDHRNITPEDIKQFFAPNEVVHQVLPYEQVFDYEGVKGRLLSSSYAPNIGEAKYGSMIDHLQKIFNKYSIEGRVTFSYDCHFYLSKIGM